ncbi:hypothetical protein K443DRAFT_15902 [Laccaria amethystina LaAM-08-1]|uniref:Uncharacterized protein n=1 Tax=Laccaria amethystina LaAM-08-1 TaxID=1095629 RepID=A0A0C9WZ02_9AGAR|nr:hypothetical protein K443DRAFT_15902 [Laccaria amethystina LaAM-08-1]
MRVSAKDRTATLIHFGAVCTLSKVDLPSTPAPIPPLSDERSRSIFLLTLRRNPRNVPSMLRDVLNASTNGPLLFFCFSENMAWISLSTPALVNPHSQLALSSPESSHFCPLAWIFQAEEGESTSNAM